MSSRRWDRGRRSRGAAPLNIQGTLGTLLRTTLHQMGVVRDAVERQARSSLGQLDAVMLQRRHRDVLARLGAAVWDRVAAGELPALAEHGEIAAILDELAELEEHAHAREEHAPEREDEDDDGAVSAADWARAAGRAAASRDERGPASRRQQELRVWRPNVADIPDPPEPARDVPAHDASRARGVGQGRGPEPADVSARAHDAGQGSPGPAGAPGTGAAPEPAGAAAQPEVAARGRGRRRHRDPETAGGIAFLDDGPGDEDDDLRAYMHEDDVPRRD